MAEMPQEVIALVNEGLGQPDNTDRPVKFMGTVSKDYKVNNVVVASLMSNAPTGLLVTDMFLGKSKENLKENPQASFAVFKPAGPGYQIKAKVKEWHTSGPLFKMIQSMAYQRMPTSILGVIEFEVEEVFSLNPGDDGKKLV